MFPYGFLIYFVTLGALWAHLTLETRSNFKKLAHAENA